MLSDALALAPPPCEALDIGCASGYISALLSHLGYRVTPTDSAATP